jgi:transcriptional regulator with XRE-family HTH domain
MILDKTNSVSDNLRMVKKQSKKLTDQLRQAIDDSGVTRYRVSKETGISESTLSKFYLGQRGLSMDALNRLGEYLGLEIIRSAGSKKRERK